MKKLLLVSCALGLLLGAAITPRAAYAADTQEGETDPERWLLAGEKVYLDSIREADAQAREAIDTLRIYLISPASLLGDQEALASFTKSKDLLTGLSPVFCQQPPASFNHIGDGYQKNVCPALQSLAHVTLPSLTTTTDVVSFLMEVYTALNRIEAGLDRVKGDLDELLSDPLWPFLGEWEVERDSIYYGKPHIGMPEVVLDRFIDKKATWEIFREDGALRMEHGGRQTWYKDRFLLLSLGIEETARDVTYDGEGIYFESSGSFALGSGSLQGLLFRIISGIAGRKIEQIKGSFDSVVAVRRSESAFDQLDFNVWFDSTGSEYGEGEAVEEVDGKLERVMRWNDFVVEDGQIRYTGILKARPA